MKIILASTSPRRRELLNQLGLKFDVAASHYKESMLGDTPQEMVQTLSYGKAEDVFRRMEDPKLLVIGADTIVACGGRRLGKPADEEDAARMLRMLSGRKHEVYTGVSMIGRSEKEIVTETFFCCTQVEMYALSEEEISWYISTKEPLDKAGAYGIQGKGAVLIRQIEGDYYNVVGLPLAKTWHSLQDLLRRMDRL